MFFTNKLSEERCQDGEKADRLRGEILAGHGLRKTEEGGWPTRNSREHTARHHPASTSPRGSWSPETTMAFDNLSHWSYLVVKLV